MRNARRTAELRLAVLVRRLRKLEAEIQQVQPTLDDSPFELMSHLWRASELHMALVGNVAKLYQCRKSDADQDIFRKLDNLSTLLTVIYLGFDINHFVPVDDEQEFTLEIWQASLTEDVRDKTESLLRKIRGMKVLAAEPVRKKAA